LDEDQCALIAPTREFPTGDALLGSIDRRSNDVRDFLFSPDRANDRRVNAKRVQRIWRRERLKVPRKQPKRGRFWLTDGSCIRLRPSWPNHVWSYDFVQDRTHNGRKFCMLTVIDEFTRTCLAIVVARRLNSDDVLQPNRVERVLLFSKAVSIATLVN